MHRQATSHVIMQSLQHVITGTNKYQALIVNFGYFMTYLVTWFVLKCPLLDRACAAIDPTVDRLRSSKLPVHKFRTTLLNCLIIRWSCIVGCPENVLSTCIVTRWVVTPRKRSLHGLYASIVGGHNMIYDFNLWKATGEYFWRYVCVKHVVYYRGNATFQCLSVSKC